MQMLRPGAILHRELGGKGRKGVLRETETERERRGKRPQSGRGFRGERQWETEGVGER